MLSRIADTLYWMSRYLERVDNTARLVEINLLHLIEADDHQPPASHWQPLLSISGAEAAYATLYPDGDVTAARVIAFMTREPTNPNAIRTSLRYARDNARIVRDRISKEMWECLNELWLRAEPRLATREAQEGMAAFCRFVRSEVARFHGVTVNTMMRGEGFGFYQLGTFIERADMTARILDVKYHLLLPELPMVGSALDYYQWAALLKSLSGFEAYRRIDQTGFRPAAVAEFVIRSGEFPRSLKFSVDRIAQALDSIGPPAKGSTTAEAMAALFAAVGVPAETIFDRGLHEFLEDFVTRTGALHVALREELLEASVGGR